MPSSVIAFLILRVPAIEQSTKGFHRRRKG